MQKFETGNQVTLGKNIILMLSGPEDKLSPNQILEQEKLNFQRPFFLIVNGVCMSRKFWDDLLPESATCMFVELPAGGGDSDPVMIIAMVAVMALTFWAGGAGGAALAAGMNVTSAGGVAAVSFAAAGVVSMGGMMIVNAFFGGMADDGRGDEQKESMYAFSQGQNNLRQGQPFPEAFGRCRIFPDLIQSSYTRYEKGNNEWIYFLGVVGVGSYDIENIFIDETPIEDFSDSEDLEYAILQPHQQPTLVPKLVWVSSTMGQDVRKDPLTFIVGPPGIEANSLEIDFLMAGGCFTTNSTGSQVWWSVIVSIEYRLVDDEGDPVDEPAGWTKQKWWQPGKNVRAFRKTKVIAVPPGRYEMRIWRVIDESTNQRTSDKVTISGVKAFGGPHPDYGYVTLFECRAKATNQLQGQLSRLFNIVATRILPGVTDTGMSPVWLPSRNPIDALAYVLITDNGGQLEEAFIDFPTLAALRADYETDDYTFDYRFTKRIIVLDAVSKIARAGRARVIMPGGRFSLVRDTLQTTPTLIFTENDYTRGSFEISHRYRTEVDSTCVEMQYVDEDTWEAKSIFCFEDSAGSLTNPAVMLLDGVTKRAQALEEGNYYYLKDQYGRSSVKFRTGMKGHIPTVGALIYLSCRASDWSQVGKIARHDESASVIWLSEPVDFKGEASGSLYYTKEDGTISSPLTVTPAAASHAVEYAISPSAFYTQEDGETASSFMFSPDGEDVLKVLVTKIIPQSMTDVAIEGEVMDPRSYGDVDDPGTDPLPFDDPLESVELDYAGIKEPESSAEVELFQFEVNWIGSAELYRVEVDNDGGGWVTEEDLFEAHNITLYTEMESESFPLRVRITPYQITSRPGLLPLEAIIKTHQLIEPCADLVISTASGVKGILVEWTHPTPSAITNFEIEIEVENGDTLDFPVVDDSSQLSHRIYDEDVQELKGLEVLPPWDEVLIIRVQAVSDDGENSSESIEDTIDMNVPPSPSSVSADTRTYDSNIRLSFVSGSGLEDRFVVLSGPEAGWPTDPNNWLLLVDMPPTTPYAWNVVDIDAGDCFEVQQPYTIAVAGYYDANKALDFLMMSTRVQAYDPNTVGKLITVGMIFKQRRYISPVPGHQFEVVKSFGIDTLEEVSGSPLLLRAYFDNDLDDTNYITHVDDTMVKPDGLSYIDGKELDHIDIQNNPKYGASEYMYTNLSIIGN